MDQLLERTKESIEGYIETAAILRNPKTMQQLKQSKEDIKLGRVRTITRVQDLIVEFFK